MSSDEDLLTPTVAQRSREYNDPRLERVASYTLTTLRLKADKWTKMMAIDEFRHTVVDWLENPQTRVLVLLVSPGGELVPKHGLSDLYHNYATSAARACGVAVPALSTTDLGAAAEAPSSSIAATTSAVVSAVVAVNSALLMPLPPPSSSFTTLDGVPRGKCAYFVRRNEHVTLTTSNFDTEILFGDFPIHSKIETLALLFDEVLQPLLENTRNQRAWPAIVSKDLSGRIKEVRNTLTEIKGKTNNRTILSLLVSPTIIEEVSAHIGQGDLTAALEPKFRNLLEEMFINWTTQIHDIINERSECVPLGNATTVLTPSATAHLAKHNMTTAVTMPSQEISFWTNRKLNLQNIYEQLRTPTHKALVDILQRIESVYFPPYEKQFRQLIAAWHEAQDVSLWLQPLQRQTSSFNSVQLSGAHELIAPLVHVLHLIWTNARFYRSTARMSVLLRCICNMLVQRASEDLELPLLFECDADEGLQKLCRTCEVLEYFKSKMLEYKERYSNNQLVLPALASTSAMATIATMTASAPNDLQQLWRFSADEVFGQTLDGFLAQLAELRTIFDAAVQFQNLEKLEIGGLRGKMLTERVKEIYAEFKLLFEQWTNIEIDLTSSLTQQQQQQQHQPQNHKWKSFKREQLIFFQRMTLLEKKLATVLLQSYNECHNWEHLLKLTLMFGALLQRRSIQPELDGILPHIFTLYDTELQQLEASVCESLLAYEFHGVSALPVPWNYPPIAGAMMWLEQHMRRCDSLGANELHEFIGKLLKEESTQINQMKYDKLRTRRDILTTKLSNLQLKIWHNWQQTIDKLIAKGLDEQVMMCNGSAEGDVRHDLKQLEINFPHNLFTLLKETKYLMALQQLTMHDACTSGGESKEQIGSVGGVAAATPIAAQTFVQLPATLMRLYDERDAYWQRRIKLIKISEYYNGIRAGVCANAALQLIHSEVRAIDLCVAAASNAMNWRGYDATLVAKIHDKSQQLYERLQGTRCNLEAILTSIRRWSREPLHQRSHYGRNLLELRHQQERVRQRLLQCDESKLLLNRLLIANFCLFFNYESQQFQIYSCDLSVQEFLREFPVEQRRQYKKYLASVDEMICCEARQAMKIRFTQMI